MKGFSEIAKGIKFGNNWDLTDADVSDALVGTS